MSRVWVWQKPNPGQISGTDIWPAHDYQRDSYYKFMSIVPYDPSGNIKSVNFTYDNGHIVFMIRPFDDGPDYTRLCVMQNEQGRELIMSDNHAEIEKYKRMLFFRLRMSDGLENPMFSNAISHKNETNLYIVEH